MEHTERQLDHWRTLFGTLQPKQVAIILHNEKFRFSINKERGSKQWIAWSKLFGYLSSQREAEQIVREEWFEPGEE